MSYKIIALGTELENDIKAAAKQVASVVKITLGPTGKTVILCNKWGQPHITKDGVTVAREIVLKDPKQNSIARLIIEASNQTAEEAGDGTTTAIVLTEAILNSSFKYIEESGTSIAKINTVAFRQGMESAGNEIIKYIKDDISTPIGDDDDEQLYRIARISANNDKGLGKLISEAVSSVGLDGSVIVEEAKALEDSIQIVNGISIERTMIHPYFSMVPGTIKANYSEANVFIYNGSIQSGDRMYKFLDFYATNFSEEPLILIADKIEGDALLVLLKNHTNGTLRVLPIKGPAGANKVESLKDIAIATGSTILANSADYKKLNQIEVHYFGKCSTVSSNRKFTTIVPLDNTNIQVAIDNRVAVLKSGLAELKTQAEANYASSQLKSRISRLTGKVAIIRIIAATEAEMRERKDRVDDAIHATRAAMEEGIVPGGGIALLDSKLFIEDTEKLRSITFEKSEAWRAGFYSVIDSLESPIITILKNAGLNTVELKHIIEIKNRSKVDENLGINANNGKITNMKHAGIIDPTKVVLVSLRKAISVAGSLLSSRAIIVTDPESEKNNLPGIM